MSGKGPLPYTNGPRTCMACPLCGAAPLRRRARFIEHAYRSDIQRVRECGVLTNWRRKLLRAAKVHKPCMQPGVDQTESLSQNQPPLSQKPPTTRNLSWPDRPSYNTNEEAAHLREKTN